MSKKKKGMLSTKRKAGSADFSRPKAKVGRKVARRAGDTDASVSTRHVSVSEQSILRDRTGGVVSKRGLLVEEHVAQLGHPNERQRSTACLCLRDVLKTNEAAWQWAGRALEGGCRLLVDGSARVRLEAVALIKVVVAGVVGERRSLVASTATAAAARLGAALASLDGGARNDAAKAAHAMIIDHADGELRRMFFEAPLLGPLAAAVRVAKGGVYRARLLRLACVVVTRDARSDVGFDFDHDVAAEASDLGVVKSAAGVLDESLENEDEEEVEAISALARRVAARRFEDDAVVECRTLRKRLADELSSREWHGRILAALCAAAVDHGHDATVDAVLAAKDRRLVRRFLVADTFSDADRRKVLEASGVLGSSSPGDRAVVVDLCKRSLLQGYDIEPAWLQTALGHPSSLDLCLDLSRRGNRLAEPLRLELGLGLPLHLEELFRTTVLHKISAKVAAVFYHFCDDLPEPALNAVLATTSAQLGVRVADAVSRRRDASSYSSFLLASLKAAATHATREEFRAACVAVRRLEPSTDWRTALVDDLSDAPPDMALLSAAILGRLLDADAASRLAPQILPLLADDEASHAAYRGAVTDDDHGALRTALHLLRVAPAFRAAVLDPHGHRPTRTRLLAIARLLRDPALVAESDVRQAATDAIRGNTTDQPVRDIAARIGALLT